MVKNLKLIEVKSEKMVICKLVNDITTSELVILG